MRNASWFKKKKVWEVGKCRIWKIRRGLEIICKHRIPEFNVLDTKNQSGIGLVNMNDETMTVVWDLSGSKYSI